MKQKQTDNLRGHFGYVADLLDQIVAQEEKIERLREALSKLESLALRPHTAGQGSDGKWHEARVCGECGGLFKRVNNAWLGNHRAICERTTQ